MRRGFSPSGRLRPTRLRNKLYIDLFCIGKAEGQLIAVDTQLHRIAKRRELDERHFRAGDHAHIQKMLAQSAFSAYALNPGRLSGLQLL